MGMRFFVFVVGWAGVTAIAGRVAADPIVTSAIFSNPVM